MSSGYPSKPVHTRPVNKTPTTMTVIPFLGPQYTLLDDPATVQSISKIRLQECFSVFRL